MAVVPLVEAEEPARPLDAAPWLAEEEAPRQMSFAPGRRQAPVAQGSDPSWEVEGLVAPPRVHPAKAAAAEEEPRANAHPKAGYVAGTKERRGLSRR